MFSRLRSFLTAWTRRERFEDSLDEEVRFHLDAYAEDPIRSGLPRREALRRARIHFGSVEGMKDDCRQARGLRLADEISRDIKHAGRSLRRDPGFGMVAVATLGLSIGATVLVFSIIDAWLFRPLSFPEPDRLTAMVLGSALEAVLYGVRPGDLVSFTAALAALLTVATGAAFAAALRATRISPVDVLRGN